MKLDKDAIKTGAEWLGAASGAGLPAMSFFTRLSPPLFPWVSLLTAALAGAILLMVARRKPRSPESVMPKAVRRDIIKCLGAAIFLLAAYVLLLQFTSVASPQGGVARYQIGFGTADWSLTERGRHWKEKDPNVTPLKILMNEASFSQELVGELWQTWTIYLAGSCLIVVYFVGFLLWTIGFAVLAKHRGKPPGAA